MEIERFSKCSWIKVSDERKIYFEVFYQCAIASHWNNTWNALSNPSFNFNFVHMNPTLSHTDFDECVVVQINKKFIFQHFHRVKRLNFIPSTISNPIKIITLKIESGRFLNEFSISMCCWNFPNSMDCIVLPTPPN